MTQLWTIFNTATKVVLCANYETPSTGSHPKDNGWPWDAATQSATRISTVADEIIHSWNGTAWVEDAAKLQDVLLTPIKEEAERRKMLAATAGGYKKMEYAAQRAEVIAWESLGNTANAILTAFNLLPVAVRALRFEYAIANAAAFGDQPADAIARFKAGMAQTVSPARIAAAEAKASAAIRKGLTPTAKRDAAKAVSWPI